MIAAITFENFVHLFAPWEWEALLRLGFCFVIGGVVGLEREFHGRPAGFRTHILLCLGCCIMMLVSNHFVRVYADLDATSAVRIDPARMAYGVITGIGFLGAGVIMKKEATVHGLTTAASLWTVAALGLAVGLGMYTVTLAGTLLALVSLTGMRHVGNWIPAHHYRVVRLTHRHMDDTAALREALSQKGVKVLHTTIDHHRAEDSIVTTYKLRFDSEPNIMTIHEMVSGKGDFARIVIS